MKRLEIPHTTTVIPLYGKDRLISDIAEFIGKDGYVSYEHGFRPEFNSVGVSDTAVHLRFAVGKNRRKIIALSELDEKQLTVIILDLFRYSNHCRLHA